ncbi:hypothetical protein M011DRAFT_473663 [Sporormia fimetaria CBS 119925]|uniref:Transcription factor Iwr1 domain-containing protein n=1 Tax=Sporormia fimetaria CBS 119925 TaxID=1340428 RepID=A0A6A6VMV1_9PLEO|nr:hypothetical protein M011DRAFT_473663 [Sporormia fimetaria CBS 119925]
MSVNAPQTLSVKRKRGDAPVEALVVATPEKRLKSDSFSLKRKLDLPETETAKRGKSVEGTVVWRLVTNDKAQYDAGTQSDAQTPTRQFHVSRKQGNVVLFERKAAGDQQQIPPPPIDPTTQTTKPGSQNGKPTSTSTALPSTPLKRPGATATINRKPLQPAAHQETKISDQTLAAFEKFSQEVENAETPQKRTPRRTSQTSPTKHTPKPPKHRYADRHPAIASSDPDAMDIDIDTSPHPDYVYDTYVREIILPDASGVVPLPQTSFSTVGYILLTEEDEEWWYEEDETDKEFDTDDEDSNAEEYYANDYPEDELSADDEFDRAPYRHFHGESDEEFDLYEGSGDEAEGGEGVEGGFVQTVPKRGVYWGRSGE